MGDMCSTHMNTHIYMHFILLNIFENNHCGNNITFINFIKCIFKYVHSLFRLYVIGMVLAGGSIKIK